MGDKGTDTRGFLRCWAAGVCSALLILLFNGPLFDAQVEVFSWTRDLSTAVDTALLLVLLAAARYRPQLIRPRAFTAVALACAMLAGILMWPGTEPSGVAAVVAGTVLTGAVDIWGIVLWLLACGPLGTRQACLCLASAGALAVAIAFFLNGFAPLMVLAATAMVCECAVPLLCQPLALPVLERARSMGAPSELEVLHPQAFLPLSHTFYVQIFAFSAAFGFALRCGAVQNPSMVAVLSFFAFGAVLAYAAARGVRLRVDPLFVASFAVIALGLMLVLLSAPALGAFATSLPVAGYMVFNMLVWLALIAAASRNAVDAVPTVCWGTAVSYLGICAGVGLWLASVELVGPLLGDPALAQGLATVALLGTLVLYVVATRRSFDLDAVIDGIAPDPELPPVEVRYVDRLEQACARLAQEAALTARETQALGLLARGLSTARIEEELGIGRNTVKYHVKNVYAKLGVHSQQELIERVGQGARG